jgi:hypothetical protein
MHRSLIGCAVALALAASAWAADIDWKLYGSVSDMGTVCFYDAKGVARTADRHIRVWTKCLSQKDLDSLDTESELGKKIIDNAVRKVMDHYVPPLALVEDVNFDQAMEVAGWEEAANLSNIQSQAQLFYELNCSERMMRRLSTYMRIKGKDRFDEKPSSWDHVAPEGNGARLLKILCPR